MKKSENTLKKILFYIGSYKFLFLLSLLFAVGTVVLTLYIPILIGQGIDFIVAPGMVDFKEITKIMIKVAVLAILAGLLQWIMNNINNKIVYHVIRDVRNKAFEKLEIVPLKFVDSHSSGELVSRVIADADQFADGLLMGFAQLFTGIVTILMTLFFMIRINVWIALLVVLMTPLSLLVANFVAKHTYHMFRKQSETRGEQTAYIDEMIGNQKIVKAFGKEKDSLARFDEINDRLETYSLKAIFYSSITNPGTRFINNLVYAAVGATGAFVAINGMITVGGLSCFLSYANQYTKPFNEISSVITELQNALACATRLFELIEEEPQQPDSETAIELPSVTGNIELKNISFSYVKEQKLIRDFSLDVKSGQRIAIVGPTGCGKTTLINLLMRFYDVNAGQILLDGVDVCEIKRESLRKSFGMVLQETWLREGTIKDNIILGKSDATDDEIIEAAKKAHAHSFIKHLPDGYQTVIGEDGGSLSQGQKQLLCITRLMLTQPPMLILDEATSSIDTRTEKKVQEAFAKLMKGKTTFIVAHRLSTIMEADVILVMRDGNIIEQGNHEDLISKNGFYANLYRSQFE